MNEFMLMTMPSTRLRLTSGQKRSRIDHYSHLYVLEIPVKLGCLIYYKLERDHKFFYLIE